ncbi:unnamed protein product [Lathyrus oleraceus]
MSQGFSSQGHVSPTHEDREEAPTAHDNVYAPTNPYLEGPSGTSLLIYYRDHVVGHVWAENTISHVMHGDFTERWHKETSSFHFPIGEMTITLDDIAFLLPLPAKGKLLDHSRIKRDETQEMMVIYLGAGMDALMQCESTRGAHAKFSYLRKLYEENLDLVDDDL